MLLLLAFSFYFFFFNDTAPTEISPLPLPDPLPIFLPVPYYHLVFTLPHELNALAQGNPRALYAMLFAAAAETLLEFGRNPRWLGGSLAARSEEHTSELQSQSNLVCRLLLEKKKTQY